VVRIHPGPSSKPALASGFRARGDCAPRELGPKRGPTRSALRCLRRGPLGLPCIFPRGRAVYVSGGRRDRLSPRTPGSPGLSRSPPRKTRWDPGPVGGLNRQFQNDEAAARDSDSDDAEPDALSAIPEVEGKGTEIERTSPPLRGRCEEMNTSKSRKGQLDSARRREDRMSSKSREKSAAGRSPRESAERQFSITTAARRRGASLPDAGEAQLLLQPLRHFASGGPGRLRLPAHPARDPLSQLRRP
jgi:hypothetical protein